MLAHTDCDRVLSESEDLLHTSGFKNTVLKALDGDIIARLGLQPVKFELEHESKARATRSITSIFSKRGWRR